MRRGRLLTPHSEQIDGVVAADTIDGDDVDGWTTRVTTERGRLNVTGQTKVEFRDPVGLGTETGPVWCQWILRFTIDRHNLSAKHVHLKLQQADPDPLGLSTRPPGQPLYTTRNGLTWTAYRDKLDGLPINGPPKDLVVLVVQRERVLF